MHSQHNSSVHILFVSNALPKISILEFIVNTDISTEIIKMSSNPLTTILNAKEDFDTVYEKLFPARKEWEKIGLSLKINPDTLGAINVDCPGDCDKALRKMLEVWFDTEECTWEKLCSCLRNCKEAVMINVLAEIHDYVIEQGIALDLAPSIH